MPYPTYNPYLSNQYVQGLMPPMVPQQSVLLPQMRQPINGIIKVKGPNSALQYAMGPNEISPAIFDENGKVFYIVSTDGTGTKTVETFDFSPHVFEQPAPADTSQFVSRQEFNELVAKVSTMIGANDGVHGSVQSAATAVGEQAL